MHCRTRSSIQFLYNFSLDAFESDLWICVVTFCEFVKINASSHCVFFFSPGQVRVKMRLFKSSSAPKLLKKTMVTLQGARVSHLKVVGKMTCLFHRWDMLVHSNLS